MNGTAMVNNRQAKGTFKGKPLPKSVIYKIIDELMLDPKASLYPIAKKFGTSHQTVMRIAAGRDAMSWLREDPKWQELHALRTGGPRRTVSAPMQIAHQGDGVVIVPSDGIAIPALRPTVPQPAWEGFNRLATGASERSQEAPEETNSGDSTPDEERPAQAVLERQPTYDPDVRVTRYGVTYMEKFMGRVEAVAVSPVALTEYDPQEIARIASVIRQAGPLDPLANAIDEALTWHDWDAIIAAAGNEQHEKYGRAVLLCEYAVGVPAMRDEYEDEEDANVQGTPTDFPGQVSPEVFGIRTRELARPDEWDNYPHFAAPMVETEAPREPSMQDGRIQGHILGLIDAIGASTLGLVERGNLAQLAVFVDNLDAATHMQLGAIEDLQRHMDLLLGRERK